MIRAYEARKEARDSLNGKWKTAILISVIYSLIVFGIGFVSSFLGVLGPIISIANIVIAPPLAYGIAYVYYHMKNGESVGYADFLTVGFKNFGRSWGIAWAIFCKCWYFIVIPIVLVIIIIVIGLGMFTASSMKEVISQDYFRSSTYSDYDYYDYYDDDYYGYDYDDYIYDNYNENSISDENVSEAILGILGASIGALMVVIVAMIIYIVFMIFAIRKLLLYSLSYYIAVENENMIPKQIVQESESLMKGNRGRLFGLILSFFGWALLISFADVIIALIPFIGPVLGTVVSVVGTSILTPYMTFAVLAFYRDLKMSNLNNNSQYAYANNGNMGQMNYQSNNNMNNGYQVNNTNMYNQNSNNMENLNHQTNTNGNINTGYQINNSPNLNQGVSMPNIDKTENKPDNSNMQNIVNNNENQMPKKYCKKCGNENAPDAMFCTKCGEKLD